MTLDSSKSVPMSPRIPVSKSGFGAPNEPSTSKIMPSKVAADTEMAQIEIPDATNGKSNTEGAVHLKLEPSDIGTEAPLLEAEQAAPTVVTTRTGRVSKTATPMSANFPEVASRNTARSRARDNGGNGSHASSESGTGPGERMSTREKRRRDGKQASEARKLALTEDVASENGEEADAEEVEGEEEEEEEEGEENEPRYCYCNEVSYGFMVACDNENCPRQWFHIRCTGLREAPDTAKWFCDECKVNMKESRRSRPNSRKE